MFLMCRIIFCLRIYYFAAQFSCLAWSASEQSLLYVAEKKLPKAVSYFEKQKPGITACLIVNCWNYLKPNLKGKWIENSSGHYLSACIDQETSIWNILWIANPKKYLKLTCSWKVFGARFCIASHTCTYIYDVIIMGNCA